MSNLTGTGGIDPSTAEKIMLDVCNKANFPGEIRIIKFCKAYTATIKEDIADGLDEPAKLK